MKTRQFSSVSTLVLSAGMFYSVLTKAQTPSNFIPVTPCRVVDTRNATGPFGGPALSAGESRSFSVPSSSCSVPSNASAYSFNIAVVPPGFLGVLTVYPTGAPLPNTANLNDYTGLVLSNAAVVAAGANGAISVFASHPTDVIIDINGYFMPQSNSTSTAVGTGASNGGAQNTAVGFNSLQLNTGTSNTAVGSYSLSANGTGSNNTALGSSALLSNALGSANTSIGANTLLNNLVGNDNTAVGFAALDSSVTASNNVAIGATSLWNTISGEYNVGVGTGTLYSNTVGSWNIALGYQAGSAVTGGNYNIDIGNSGTSSDSGVIRIGKSGSQNSAYIAGVVGSTVSGVPVIVNANGQLGVQTSSARFKEDIQDIGDITDALMKLRPVIFRYRSPASDNSTALHYGLIAEEVDKIYPQLVFRDANKQPFALAYQELPVLLLNQIQKEHRIIAQQQSKIDEQEKQLQTLSERLAVLEHLETEKPKR